MTFELSQSDLIIAFISAALGGSIVIGITNLISSTRGNVKKDHLEETNKEIKKILREFWEKKQKDLLESERRFGKNEARLLVCESRLGLNITVDKKPITEDNKGE